MTGPAAIAAVAAALAQVPAPPSAPVRSGEVALDVDRCPALPREEIVRLLSLELGAPIAEAVDSRPHVTHLVLSCAGSEVEMAAADLPSGRRLRQVMVLPSIETRVAARLVALAASELVVTSRMPEPPATNPSVVVAPAPAGMPAAPATEATRAGYVLAQGQVTGPFRGVGPAWGGGLRLGWAWPGRLVADIELSAATGEPRSPLGNVRVSLWSAAGRAFARFRHGRVWLDLGGGGRFGVARLVGVPDDPTAARGGTVAGTWAAAIADAGVGVRLSHLLLGAGIEAGHVLGPVDGMVDGGSPVSIAGPFVSGHLAVGWGR